MAITAAAKPSSSLLGLFIDHAGNLDKLNGKEFNDSWGNTIKLLVVVNDNTKTKTIEFEVSKREENVKLGIWQRAHIFAKKTFSENKNAVRLENRYKNKAVTSRAYNQCKQLDAHWKYNAAETDTSFAKMFAKEENQKVLKSLVGVESAEYRNQKQLASPFFDSRHFDLTPDNTVFVKFKVPKTQVKFLKLDNSWQNSTEALPELNMVMSKCDVARLLIKGSLTFGKDPKDEFRMVFNEHYKITVKSGDINETSFSQVTDQTVKQTKNAIGGLNIGLGQVRMLNQKSWFGFGKSIQTYGRGGAMDMPPFCSAHYCTLFQN